MQHPTPPGPSTQPFTKCSPLFPLSSDPLHPCLPHTQTIKSRPPPDPRPPSPMPPAPSPSSTACRTVRSPPAAWCSCARSMHSGASPSWNAPLHSWGGQGSCGSPALLDAAAALLCKQGTTRGGPTQELEWLHVKTSAAKCSRGGIDGSWQPSPGPIPLFWPTTAPASAPASCPGGWARSSAGAARRRRRRRPCAAKTCVGGVSWGVVGWGVDSHLRWPADKAPRDRNKHQYTLRPWPASTALLRHLPPATAQLPAHIPMPVPARSSSTLPQHATCPGARANPFMRNSVAVTSALLKSLDSSASWRPCERGRAGMGAPGLQVFQSHVLHACCLPACLQVGSGTEQRRPANRVQQPQVCIGRRADDSRSRTGTARNLRVW